MNILFDTHVVLDVLLKRLPHAPTAARLFAAVEHRFLTGFVAATTMTTIFYLAEKVAGASQARQDIRRLLTLFTVAPVNRPVLDDALQGQFADYDDAVLHEAARHIGAEGIVTRNGGDFTAATLRIYTPDELLAIIRLLTPSP
ncbi:MAG: PIN domain-containing protein [candidate division Zixibacteria bacterium]|nr:PIN domain-containing protein [candidate division Zixibacteria bacterium]